MKTQKLGYIRVSSADQNPARQLELLEKFELDKQFIENVSAKDKNRPQLKELIAYAREGDHIYVASIDRFARNTADLLELVKQLGAKGVGISFVKENLNFIGGDDAISNLMLTIIGACAEFERSLIRERQRQGIELAKKNGIKLGRRRVLTPQDFEDMKKKIESGVPKSRVAREYKIATVTLYKYLREEVTSGQSHLP